MLVVLEHVAWEHLDQWGPTLESAGMRGACLYAGDKLPALEDVQGVVVMGGSMNVYEEEAYPFLAPENAFIREALRLGIPYLGVCLGAQLLAKALGARVYANPVREIGYYRIECTEKPLGDPLLAGLPKHFTALQWHGDTFDLPPGARLLATSPTCRNQAFRYGRNAYGLQFHLEVGPEMVADWCARYPEELEPFSLSPATLVAAAQQQEAALGPLRQQIMKNFLDIVSGAAKHWDKEKSR